MTWWRKVAATLATSLSLGVSAAAYAAPAHSTIATSGTTRFVLDGNRVYAELAFVRPDGSRHKALAFVDMGEPSMSLNQALCEELRLDPAHPLVFQVGALTVTVPAARVSESHEKPQKLGAETVEGTLPASVLQNFQVILDYRERTLTLARPGVLKPAGVATPFHLNSETGLIAIDVSIDDRPYAVTVDNGSAWTWFRQQQVLEWSAHHPAWMRGVGAVGASNMMMVGDLEATGLLARVPAIRSGDLTLSQVDVLGPGPTTAFPFELFDWYSKKNAVTVLGWIGGNVLKAYRLTIDYPGHTLYWQRQAAPDVRELDQVGLTLQARAAAYFVSAIATKHGGPTVTGVQRGDQLVAVDGMPLKGATWGAIFQALHGAPGARRALTLDRAGQPVSVSAVVTAF